ncbi:MAG: response regulator transcription factor [Dechloromonas sp.]|jgi:two-component system response regulator QseB|nr:response regulator transcription factor [Dechloromonas sp.]
MHILIVEDDRVIAENLYDFLESCGHQCDFAPSLGAADALLRLDEFDALVLDRCLPDGDGALLASRLRAAGKSLAILMLTARDMLDDKLAGFGAGADDYLAKPFALKEVEARLQALLRRSGGQGVAQRLVFGALSYDPAERAVTLAGRPLTLPPKALRLVEVLLQQPQRVLSRRELEMAVWGHEQEASDNLRSVLHTARRALADAAPVRIVNVHGLGYKLVSR